MSIDSVKYRSLRRSQFASKAEYDLFLNHLINPLIENIDSLNEYIYNLCRDEERLSGQLIVTDLVKMKKQIQKHIIWKQLYDSYLPMTHQHEFTLLILNQLIIDYTNVERDIMEMNALQNQHLLIIIRFINGLLDYYQKSKYALSLVKIAEKLEIPSWIVELRHIATHERELPNIDILRKGLVWALRYLVESHWKCSEEATTDTEDEKEQAAAIAPWGGKRKLLHNSDESSDNILQSWNTVWSQLSNKKWGNNEAMAYYESLKTSQSFKSGFEVNNKQSKQHEFLVLLEQFKDLWKALRDKGKEDLINDIISKPLQGIKLTMVKIFIKKFHKFDFMIVQLVVEQNCAKDVYSLIDFNLFCRQHEDKLNLFNVNVLKEMLKVLKSKPEYRSTFRLVNLLYKEKLKAVKLSTNESSTKELNFQETNAAENKKYIFELQEDWQPKPFGVL